MKKFKLPPNTIKLLILAYLAVTSFFNGFEASLMMNKATYVDPANATELSQKGELGLLNTTDDSLIYFTQGDETYSTLNTEPVLGSLTFVEASKVDNNLFYQTIFVLLSLWMITTILKSLGFIKPISINAGGPGKQLHNSMTDISSYKVPLPQKGLDSMAGLLPETTEEIQTVLEIAKMNFKKNDSDTVKMKSFIQPVNGVLLHGPPGTGKTMLAKAMAKELDAGFYHLTGSSLDRMYVGVGAGKLENLFRDAKENSKERTQVIFIDEVDALAKKRSGEPGANKEETLNQLLSEMTEIRGENVLMIFATNFYQKLDDAFLRSERIDYKIEIPKPDMEGRKELIELKARESGAEHLLEYAEDLSRQTFDLTGADIGDFFNKAQMLAHRRGTDVTIDDVYQALERQALGTKGRIQISGKRKERVAYHEAGHALLQLHYFPGSVNLATIAPHSGSLGLVAMKGNEDSMLMIRSELLNRITVSLGGAAAEITEYGDDHSAGVSGDFDSVRKISSAMVKELGMSLTGINFLDTEKEEKAEITKIILHCLEDAKKIIAERKDTFETIAKTLLEKETIRGEELEELMKLT